MRSVIRGKNLRKPTEHGDISLSGIGSGMPPDSKSKTKDTKNGWIDHSTWCPELGACGLRLGACGLCRGARIEYTYNEFNCLVRITYNVFVGGGILAVKPPILSPLSPLSPVSRLSPKTFHAPRSRKLFFESLQFSWQRWQIVKSQQVSELPDWPSNPVRVTLNNSEATSSNCAWCSWSSLILESFRLFLVTSRLLLEEWFDVTGWFFRSNRCLLSYPASGFVVGGYLQKV